MIETVQYWIWNISGFIGTILFIASLFTLIFSWVLNYWIGWSKSKNRETIWYYVKHKKRIMKIVEKELKQ